MFAPISKGVGILFALGALICWGSWSVTLTLATDRIATDRMSFELYYYDFTILYLLTGIIVAYILGEIPGPNPAPGFEDAAFTTELFGHNFGTYMFSMLGGLLWNTSNIIFGKAIGLMGTAIGFPLAVGVAMISGSLTNYFLAAGDTKLEFLLAGDCIALLGICAVGLLAYRKERELEQNKELWVDAEKASKNVASEGPSMLRKFMICVISGLLNGASNFGVINATTGNDKMSPPANQIFFSFAVFISTFIVIPLSVLWPVEGHPAKTTIREIISDYPAVSSKDHALAALGGFALCSGFFFYNLGNNTDLGAAPTYSIGQSAPIAGILWGTFFFKEFQGLSCKVQGIIPVVVALFASAILCMALA